MSGSPLAAFLRITKKEARMILRAVTPLLCGLLLFLSAGAADAGRDRGGGPMKVIFDTDVGDDIDDAYALVLIASRPQVRLLGVTTAFGETRERAELAARLLHLMGRRDVPV